ncbi:MAG: PDZ domain-containing protein [bacterium]|nr:PDZ domain-containing protein [bacterium]
MSRPAERERFDPVVREVLARVETSYLEPDRISPARMIDGALRAAGRHGGTIPAEPVPQAAGAESLAELVAPTIENSLNRLVETSDLTDEPEAVQNLARAVLLGGAVGTLDRYCRAVSGEARARMVGRFTGTQGGIGVRIGRREGRIRVLACVAGSNAASAGLQAGDELLEVDDLSVAGLTVGGVIARLRGKPGSVVKIRIDRIDGLLCVERRRFTTRTVSHSMLRGSVVHLRLTHLSKRSPEQFDRHLAQAQAHGARGAVLDLRNNSGGSMLAAATIADRFVERGVLLETADREGLPVAGLRQRVDASSGRRFDEPLLVLVNGATASSAELLAAALARHERGVLYGCHTFGKNFVQKLHHFDAADLTLKLSVAYVRTAGALLPAEGLEPDVFDAAADDTLSESGTDRALEAALDVLADAAAS